MKFLYWSGRQLRRVAFVMILLTLSAAVLAMGGAYYLLQSAQKDPASAKQWLSAQAGSPLDFDSLQSSWTRTGPVINVTRLRVGEGAQRIELGDAQVILAMYSGWLPKRSFSQVRLTGLKLHLYRHDDGRWELLGLPKSDKPQSDPLNALSRLGELQVVRGSMRIEAPTLGIDTRFPTANVRLRATATSLRGGLQAWSQLSEVPISAAIEYDRTRRDGVVWVESSNAQLSDWASLLRFGDLRVDRGLGTLSTWLQIRSQRVTQITGKANLKDVALSNVGAQPGFQQFERLDAVGSWSTANGIWSLALPTLSVVRGGERSDMGDTLLAGGRVQLFQAKRLNGSVLADMAEIIPWLPTDLRRYLQASHLRANLRDVQFYRRNGVIEKLAGQIRDVHVMPALGYPGLSGLSADVKGTDGDWIVSLSGADSVLTIPQSLLEPLRLRVDGDVRIQQLVDRVHFSTPNLRTTVEGYPVRISGSVDKLTTRPLPTFNLRLTADRFPLNKAKLFWIRNKMPSAAIAWLDPAFIGGEVRNVNATFVGNPQDWPFTDGHGLKATGQLVNGQIHFANGWPDATRVNGDLRFINDGFTVKARGMIDRIPVDDISVSIDRYRGGTLRIRAGAVTDGSNGIALLAKSPLARHDSGTFDNLRVKGPLNAGFALDLPLVPNTQLAINGVVDFRRVQVSDPRYQITMNQLVGRGTFDRHGFIAENLEGTRDGVRGNLAVRVGEGHVRDATNIVEVNLASAIAPAVMERYTTSLNWLKPYLHGNAKWNVQVNVPSSSQGNRPAMLLLKSDLVGMELNLPEPLAKTAAQPLATQIEIPMPLENREIFLRFGDRASMKVVTRADKPWVRAALGSGTVAMPTEPGLTVEGTTERMSALDWIAVAKGDSEVSGKGGMDLSLNRINVVGRNVYLLGGNFRNTRIHLKGEPGGGMNIVANGPQLRGTVAVPASGAQAIKGTFELIHFSNDGLADTQVNRSLTGSIGTSTAARAVRNAALSISNPANIPPLLFTAQRLQIGSINLGSADFASIPTANGLKVTRMKTQHSAFSITGDGTWTQRDGQQQTSVAATIQTHDAGKAVATCGAPNQVDGGKGALSLQGAWTGGPQDFAVAKLRGTMAIDVRDGRIPELEPGVGRVLGLLSIAELPRRLTLDFKDFFGKGLRFNSVTGSVDLANGVAKARDLKIDAPAALISIEGTSDLRAERFNQLVTVEPRAGGLLTAIGAVAAGPVGAAVGAVANAVLENPIGQMAVKRYRVTGPWKSPQTETVPAGSR